MTAAYLSLLLGLGQGLLHGFGPDHCAAMATLGSLDRSPGGALRAALRFAVGHAIVLGSLAAACLLLGVGLSGAFERWAEIGGGAVLVALAAWALFSPGSLGHGHPHLPGHAPGELGGLSAAAGALMGLSGVRALALALPPLLVGGGRSAWAWAYLPGFAGGVLLSMTAVGVLLSGAFRRTGERVAPWLHRGVAVSSGALGVAWIAAHL